MQALALLSPNTLQMALPNGLEEESSPNTPPLGFLVKQFCDVGLWMKGHLESSNNNHVGQTKLLSEHLGKSLHTLLLRLHRHRLAADGQGAYAGKHKVSLHISKVLFLETRPWSVCLPPINHTLLLSSASTSMGKAGL